MFLVALNHSAWLTCLVCVTVVEFLRILVVFILNKPSSEAIILETQKAEANLELNAIKSVQLELVRHSLLTRKVIKIDKQIQKIKDDHAPRTQSIKQIARVVRIAIYGLVSLYFFNTVLAIVDPKILWPLSMVIFSNTVHLSPLSILIAGAFAARHTFRTLLQLIFRDTEFV